MKEIILRPYTSKDALSFLQLLKNNNKRLRHSFPLLLTTCFDEASTIQFISNQNKEWEEKTKYAFGIFLANQGKLIGHIFAKNISWHVPKCELGYLLDVQFTRKGITTGAMALLVKFCFEHLEMQKIFLRISPSNIASKRVAQKSGFEFEARLKKDFRTFDDELIDVEYYARFSKNIK